MIEMSGIKVNSVVCLKIEGNKTKAVAKKLQVL
jgi:hypothetical protein